MIACGRTCASSSTTWRARRGARELDLILCRNVLIYFDEARRAEALARLVRALRAGRLAARRLLGDAARSVRS